MTAPAGLQAVLDRVSGTIICVERCGAITVEFDPERGRTANRHPYADCPNSLHPDSPSAVALAEFTQAVLRRTAVAIARESGVQCGEDLPVNTWLAA